MIVATTLMDRQAVRPRTSPICTTKDGMRNWIIRSIKQTLGMDMIHCKTPAMVRNSLWAHLLGYNLVRKVAAQAAWTMAWLRGKSASRAPCRSCKRFVGC